jgi:ElaB/YqjD/DUF883 family membrane-anchored ribosome-binding protein
MATKSTKSEPADAVGEERSPEQIEADIEATREEVGKTAAEHANKADTKQQAKRKPTETKARAEAKAHELKEKASAQKEAATARVIDATPDSVRDGAQRAAAQATQLARENPLPTAALGAFVGGVIMGWTLGRR